MQELSSHRNKAFAPFAGGTAAEKWIVGTQLTKRDLASLLLLVLCGERLVLREKECGLLL